MTDYADASAIESIAAEWPDSFVECRARRQHAWRPLDIIENRYYNVHTIVERCGTCKGERQRDETPDGKVLTEWSRVMKPGYAIEGIGIIAGPSQDVLVKLYRQQSKKYNHIIVTGKQAKVDVPRSVLREERAASRSA